MKDPQFQNRPDQDDRKLTGRIITPSAKQPFVCVILSVDVIGAMTHYMTGKTLICTGDDCPCKLSMIERRWQGFLCGWSPKTRNRGIVRITGGCLDPLDAWLSEHGTLRAAEATFSRTRPQDNAPLVVALREARHGESVLPESLDVMAYLRRMWRLPEIAETQRRLDGRSRRDVVLPPRGGKGRLPRANGHLPMAELP